MTANAPFNRIGRARHGHFIYNVHDPVVGRSIELYGEYSEPVAAIFDQVLQEGNVVIDVGSNIGLHTVFLAHKVGSEGRVLSFEPQRLLFHLLCGNVALNSITNTFCWNMAVGAQNGEITVPVIDVEHPEKIVGLPLGESDEGESVPVVAIDSLNLPDCHLIKIACEIGQEDVIAGAVSTIARFKPIIYIECNHTTADQGLIGQLSALGYDLYWHETNLYNADNFNGNEENVFEDRKSMNVLCIDKAADRQLTGFTEIEIPHAA